MLIWKNEDGTEEIVDRYLTHPEARELEDDLMTDVVARAERAAGWDCHP